MCRKRFNSKIIDLSKKCFTHSLPVLIVLILLTCSTYKDYYTNKCSGVSRIFQWGGGVGAWKKMNQLSQD